MFVTVEINFYLVPLSSFSYSQKYEIAQKSADNNAKDNIDDPSMKISFGNIYIIRTIHFKSNVLNNSVYCFVDII